MPNAPMPPVEGTVHLIEWLTELGLVERGDMGTISPLSWPTLKAWSDLTQRQVAPWEAKALRNASKTYVEYLNLGSDPMCPCPWDELASQAVNIALDNFFEGRLSE